MKKKTRQCSLLQNRFAAFRSSWVRIFCEGKASFGNNLKNAAAALKLFRKEFASHAKTQKSRVFPFLERHLPKLGAHLELLSYEHGFFDRDLIHLQKELLKLKNARTAHARQKMIDRLNETSSRLSLFLDHHLQTENVIFNISSDSFRGDEKRRFRRAFGRSASCR